MMNPEEKANIVQLMEDLETDLRNGNIPAAKLLIISLANNLALKQPIEWQRIGTFLSDHLDDPQLRTALLHLLPKLRELVSPFQADQIEEQEC